MAQTPTPIRPASEQQAPPDKPLSEYDRFKAAMTETPQAKGDKLHEFVLMWAKDQGIDYENMTPGKKGVLKRRAKEVAKQAGIRI